MNEKYAREIIENIYKNYGGKIIELDNQKGLLTKWAIELGREIFVFTNYKLRESFQGNEEIHSIRNTGYNIIPVYLVEKKEEVELINSNSIVVDNSIKKIFYNDESVKGKADIIGESLPRKKEDKKREELGLVTIIIIVINILAYLLTGYLSNNIFDADINVLIRLGAKYNPLITGGEYYRLITAGFLHGGIIHLVLNMVALYSIGPVVEKYFGKLKYIIIYAFSLILSSYASYLLSKSVSIGASGAIFGLLGSLLIIGLTDRKRNYLGFVKNILNVIIINLIIGFTIPNIDNYGHLGGLLGGALITYVIIRLDNKLFS